MVYFSFDVTSVMLCPTASCAYSPSVLIPAPKTPITTSLLLQNLLTFECVKEIHMNRPFNVCGTWACLMAGKSKRRAQTSTQREVETQLPSDRLSFAIYARQAARLQLSETPTQRDEEHQRARNRLQELLDFIDFHFLSKCVSMRGLSKLSVLCPTAVSR